MQPIRALRVLAVLLLLPAAACATSGATGGTGGEGGASLEVVNNLTPPTSISVYAVPDVGTRRMIGVVEPGGTRILRFDPAMASGQFRFLAQPTSGNPVVSNPINIPRGADIRWDLTSNIARVVGG